MPLREHGPFLGKNKRELCVVRTGVARRRVDDVHDVLHHALFLIVSLFNQKRVVLNPLRQSLRPLRIGRGRLRDRCGRHHGECQSRDERSDAE